MTDERKVEVTVEDTPEPDVKPWDEPKPDVDIDVNVEAPEKDDAEEDEKS